MSKKIKRHRYYIDALSNSTSPKKRKNLLAYANRDQILALSEIFANFLQNNI